MNYKSKIVMSVLQECRVDISLQKLQFLMYLLCKKYLANNIYFDFVTIDNQPFSFELENEVKQLIKKKKIVVSDSLLSADDEKRYAKDLAFEEKMALHDVLHDSVSVYQKQEVAESDEIIFYTIGYEGSSLDQYLNKLILSGVKLLVDVRKNSYSKKFGFSKAELSGALTKVGVGFLHMPELGIESEKRQELRTVADYDRLFSDYENSVLVSREDKIQELVRLLEVHRKLAITCFEADVSCCHRGRVAKRFRQMPNFNYQITNL